MLKHHGVPKEFARAPALRVPETQAKILETGEPLTVSSETLRETERR